MHKGAIRRKGKKIMGLVDALRNGKVEYTGNKSSNVKIELGDGNANINVRGNNVNITTGTGNQNVVVLGNDVDIKLDQNALSDWDSSLDKDTVAVVSDKGNVKIDTGDGNDTAIAVADNVNINMGKGDHLVAFWGDDVKMKLGDGDNGVYTMDKMIALGGIDESTTILGEAVGKAAVEAVEVDTLEFTNVLKDITTNSGTDKTTFFNEIKNKYNLDASNMKELETLYDNGELFKEFKSGVPQYAIVQSVTQKNADGTAKYVIAKVDSSSGDYIHTRGWKDGKFTECIATKQAGVSSYTEQQTVTREVTTQHGYRIDGTKNLEIDFGNGEVNNINVTSTGKVRIEGGDYSKENNIQIDAEAIAVDNPETEVTKTTSPARKISWGTNVGSTYTSPIIVDFNRDGKVSATSGNTGVDVDGNGIADGAATGGDKMLAMSDLNGNGSIDGSEVFGDQTVSPFTGEKINAANGFEALKVIAQQAEQYTGTKCYSNGQVDLQALKAALATVGVNLGFISENNTTELEDLAHVAALNVDDYSEVDATGDAQHRQQGSYVDTDGNTYGADDVWFKNRTKADNILERLKNN